MHIDNSYLTNRPIKHPEETVPVGEAVRGSATEGPAPVDVSVHVPSAELMELLARVKQAPEVREEVLQRVAQKLATGFYLSREAAEQTAEAILETGD